MGWHGPRGSCGCCGGSDCECPEHPCYQEYGNFSSVRVEVEFSANIWEYYERYKLYSCGTFGGLPPSSQCPHWTISERWRSMGGFTQFNGTYDIQYYALVESEYVESTPEKDPCGFWFFPDLTFDMTRNVTLLDQQFNPTSGYYPCSTPSETEYASAPPLTLRTATGQLFWPETDDFDPSFDSIYGPSARELTTGTSFSIPTAGVPETAFTGISDYVCDGGTGEDYNLQVFNAEWATDTWFTGRGILLPVTQFSTNGAGFGRPPGPVDVADVVGGVRGTLVSARSEGGCIRRDLQHRRGITAFSFTRTFDQLCYVSVARPPVVVGTNEHDVEYSALSYRIKVDINV